MYLKNTFLYYNSIIIFWHYSYAKFEFFQNFILSKNFKFSLHTTLKLFFNDLTQMLLVLLEIKLIKFD